MKSEGMLFESTSSLDRKHVPSDEDVLGLYKLLEDRAGERQMHAYLKNHPALLTTLFVSLGTGHGGFRVFSEQAIRHHVKGVQKGLVPDFMVAASNSDGESWWLVELKAPTAPIFSGSSAHRLSRETNGGITQLLEYLEHGTAHQGELRSVLGLTGFKFPKGVLLIGRDCELKNERLRKIKQTWNNINPNLQIRTYDAFLRGWEEELSLLPNSAP